jgi:hypothetical protein
MGRETEAGGDGAKDEGRALMNWAPWLSTTYSIQELGAIAQGPVSFIAIVPERQFPVRITIGYGIICRAENWPYT